MARQAAVQRMRIDLASTPERALGWSQAAWFGKYHVQPVQAGRIAGIRSECVSGGSGSNECVSRERMQREMRDTMCQEAGNG
jgi:hypothetical protein